MKVLSLNIQHRGGSRWEHIERYLEAQDADVIVLPECRMGSPAEKWAKSLGMYAGFASQGKNRNGVFVAAKHFFKTDDKTPGQGSSGALLRVEFDSWSMLACYVPGVSSKEPKLREAEIKVKKAYFEKCREAASYVDTRPLLIIGDLNTGNQEKDKTKQGEKYACSEDFDNLSRKLCDLWRRTNRDKQEWTWLTPKNGFRLDHAFGNAPFVERFDPSCCYDDGPRKANFTDHSAVIVSMSEAVRSVPNPPA